MQQEWNRDGWGDDKCNKVGAGNGVNNGGDMALGSRVIAMAPETRPWDNSSPFMQTVL